MTGEPAATAGAGADLKGRIAEFAGRASLEITANDRELAASLTGRLPAGSTLYVAHTPNARLADVAETAW